MRENVLQGGGGGGGGMVERAAPTATQLLVSELLVVQHTSE